MKPQIRKYGNVWEVRRGPFRSFFVHWVSAVHWALTARWGGE